MIRIGLIRHGHTPWNRAGRIQGRSDIALDDEAAAALAELRLPEGWEGAELWSSPLARASETARLITGRTPQTSPALIEMNWGGFEGLRGVDLIEDPASGYAHIEDWGWDFRPPEGESPREVLDRLMPWVADRQTDTIAVCHIGIMRVLLAAAHGWEFRGQAPFRVKRNRIFELLWDGTRLHPGSDPERLVPRE